LSQLNLSNFYLASITLAHTTEDVNVINPFGIDIDMDTEVKHR